MSRTLLDRIVFTSSADVHAEALAEFALFGVLAGAKGLPRLRSDREHGRWPKRWEMRQLSEMTVLIAGLGRIGAECARLFTGAGATVWGTTRSGTPVPGVARLIPIERLAEAAAQADAMVVTLPGTAKTHHIVSADVLAAAKPGLIIASVGRGTAMDESALLRALEDGHVSFAALEVFEAEPLAQGSPLWAHPRVLVSPHTAALSAKEEERIARMFADNATRFLDGRPMRSMVNTIEFY